MDIEFAKGAFIMQGIEIEKKYKVRNLPKDLEFYKKIEIVSINSRIFKS